MFIQKKRAKKSTIKASNRQPRTRRALRASEEEEIIDDEVIEEAEVDVAPEATDLLFEAEDVAELIAEVTGEDVAVTADEDVVTFEVGDDEFAVTAEGDEELLEASKKVASKKVVKASKKVVGKRVAKARK